MHISNIYVVFTATKAQIQFHNADSQPTWVLGGGSHVATSRLRYEQALFIGVGPMIENCSTGKTSLGKRVKGHKWSK